MGYSYCVKVGNPCLVVGCTGPEMGPVLDAAWVDTSRVASTATLSK